MQDRGAGTAPRDTVPRGSGRFDVAFACFSDTIFRNTSNVWEHREESEDATQNGLVSRRSTSVIENQRFVKALGQQPLAYFTASSSLDKRVQNRLCHGNTLAKFTNFASLQE